MCYIQFTIKTDKSKTNSDVELVLRQKLTYAMADNDDGFFIKNGGKEIKTLDKEQAIVGLQSLNIDGMIAHCRLATQGEVTMDNVHGYKKGKWQFVHNGYAWGAAGAKYKSDSRIFFYHLVSLIDNISSDKKMAKKIQKACDDMEFYGRAILIDNSQDRAFLFGDFQSYLINNSYLAIASASQDFDALTTIVSAAGIDFQDKDGIRFHVLHKELDGIYVVNGIHSAAPKFKFLKEFEQGTAYGFKEYRSDQYDDDYGYANYGKSTKGTLTSVPAEQDRYYCNEDGFRYYVTDKDEKSGYYDMQNVYHPWDDLYAQVEEFKQRRDEEGIDWDNLTDREYWQQLNKIGFRVNGKACKVPKDLPVSETTTCIAEIIKDKAKQKQKGGRV